MYHSLLPLIGWAATLLVCVLAWWRGGPAERYGASFIILAALAVSFAHFILPPSAAGLSLLTIDALMAVGFLALAIRFSSLWLGAAMLLQAGQFSLHAWYLVSSLERDYFYAVANNLITAGILLCILIGTMISWSRKGKAVQAT
ncbi:MAG: hypothetical protein Q8L23_18000 [Caulobacter sp.]|nr:hypothetical protein [Caulobacter sp.]